MWGNPLRAKMGTDERLYPPGRKARGSSATSDEKGHLISDKHRIPERGITLRWDSKRGVIIGECYWYSLQGILLQS